MFVLADVANFFENFWLVGLALCVGFGAGWIVKATLGKKWGK